MAMFRAVDHFRRYVWGRKASAVLGVDLAVPKSAPFFQVEQVSSGHGRIQHGSTVATRSSLLAPGCPVKSAVF